MSNFSKKNLILDILRNGSLRDKMSDKVVVTVGDPEFIKTGEGLALDLDGSNQYGTVALDGLFDGVASISFVMEFTPDFDWDEDAYRMLFDSSYGSRYLLFTSPNGDNNTLGIWLGDTDIANIASTTYSPYWNVGEKNIIIVSGTTGNTSAWLNGNKILDSDNTAWSALNPANLYVGNRFNQQHFFDGKIHSFKVYDTKFTDLEAEQISNENLIQGVTGGAKRNFVYPKPTDLSKEAGLVGAWNMIPSPCGVLSDISGNGNTGTIYGGALATEDGMSFDGVNDYVRIPKDDSWVFGTNDFTVNFGVKIASSSSGYVVGNYPHEGSNGVFIFFMDTVSPYNFDLYSRGSDGVYESFYNIASWDGPEEEWVHFSFTRKNLTTMDFYVNGVWKATKTLTNNGDFNWDGYNHFDVAENLYMEGEIDDLKIYNRALSPQEIKDQYNKKAKQIYLLEDFKDTGADGLSGVPDEWTIDSGTFTREEDTTSKYILCGTNGVISFDGIDLSGCAGNGYIKTLDGDLSGDAGDTVDNATNVAFANNKLSFTMTAGQKLRKVVIQKAIIV